MTGTALTEATEFMKIYKLPVVQIPTNLPMVRDDRNDQVYKTKEGKWAAVAKEIEARHDAGQPVLVGTISVEVSELLSRQLTARGSSMRCSTPSPSSPSARARRSPRPARRARSRSPPTWPAAASTSSSAATPSTSPARGAQARARARDARLRRALRQGAAVDRGARRAAARAGAGGRRDVHHRHRAPRVAPDRQPAARPRRAPGRPRRVTLLPVRPGRSRAPVRRRADLQDPRSARVRPTRRATRSRSRPGCSPSRSRRRRRRSRSSTS